MTEKTSSKLPYLILPNLSSNEDDEKLLIPKPSNANARPSRSNLNTNTLIKNAKTELSETLPPITVKVPPVAQLDIKPNALSRHIALSKQFAAAANSKAIKEIQATQKRVLLSQYELRSSPHPLYYPSENSESIEIFKEEKEIEKNEKLRQKSLDSLSQMFPNNKIQKVRPNYVRQKVINSDLKNEHNNLTQAESKTDDEPNKGIGPLKSSGLRETVSSGDLTCDQLKAKIDTLYLRVNNRDTDISQLKQDLIDLQLLVLKEKKESEISKTLIERLLLNNSTLEEKMTSLERAVAIQEKNILEKLFMFDDSSDSDSEYGKPSKWISPAIPQTKTQTKDESSNPNAQQSGGVSALKECINWVPIAPDFDKLLNAIALLNFRMDRNQSMKLCRNGNEATFQHADSINLTIYKNGLVLGSSGFRSYATLSVIKLINEMFSGFFPSELHSQYPDGIIFVVSDKRAILHDISLGFNGPGMKLSDSTTAPILIPGLDKLSAFQKPKSKPIVADITTSNTSIISKASVSVSCINLPELSPIISPLTDPKNDSKRIELKLKDTFTGKSYRLQVSVSSTIDEIIRHLGKHIKSSSNSLENPKYDLILPVPYGILTSGNSSLKEYGMVNNTLLYIKPSELPSSSDIQL